MLHPKFWFLATSPHFADFGGGGGLQRERNHILQHRRTLNAPPTEGIGLPSTKKRKPRTVLALRAEGTGKGACRSGRKSGYRRLEGRWQDLSDNLVEQVWARAVLKRGGGGFVTPTETGTLSTSWSRHGQNTKPQQQCCTMAGGWRRLAVGGGWRLARGGPWGPVLKGSPEQNKKTVGVLKNSPAMRQAHRVNAMCPVPPLTPPSLGCGAGSAHGQCLLPRSLGN